MDEKKKPPTWNDFEHLAKEGKIEEFMARALDLGLDLQPHHERFRQLRSAIRSYDGNITDLIDVAFEQSIRFDLGLLLQYQMQAEHVMKWEGKSGGPAYEAPAVTTTVWLERVQRLQDRLVWLSERYARIQHVIGKKERKKPRHVEKLEELRETLKVINKETA